MFIYEQELKAYAPMFFKDLGSFNKPKEVQPSKAELPISVNLLSPCKNFKLSIFEQSLNANAPIVLTLVGKNNANI